MTGSSCTCTYTAFFRPMNMKLAAVAAQSSSGRRNSRGCRPAVGPSAVAASPGKQMLLVRRHPPVPGRRHLPSLGCTSRAATASGVAATSTQAKEEDDRASRNISGFQPFIWGDFFLTYTSPLATSSAQKAWMAHRAEQLKGEVAKLIAASCACSLCHRIHLIDVLERLCLDHLFEDEIKDMLTQINSVDVSGCDLQTVAMWFYLLRKHGYRVSSDVFAKFRDEQGSFAANSPRDLLNLYNAACLGTHGERILDEAMSFTTKCLKSTAPYMKTSLASEIKHALEIPLPRSVRIYEAKSHIAEYGRETGANELVMELAKLNCNLVQLQHQEELKIITRSVVDHLEDEALHGDQKEGSHFP